MAGSEHTKLLTAAARSVLRPIGCTQKGHSRIWLDDHGWWVTLIEFQPHAWASGSFLNVGACWMWSKQEHFSFDDGHRVEGFREFTDINSFAHSAHELAERAKQEALEIRDRFRSIEVTAAYLDAKKIKDSDIWGHFHAGVSAGIAGWADKARARLGAATKVAERDLEWVRALKQQCVSLLCIADDTLAFRSQVKESVAQRRKALKLAPWAANSRVEF